MLKSLFITVFFSQLLVSVSSVAQPGHISPQKINKEKIDSYIDSLSREYGFNGVALLAQKGEILFQKGYGWKDVKNKTTNDSTSIFQIGSITKQFTAAIILKLQEEGKLSVQEIPSFL